MVQCGGTPIDILIPDTPGLLYIYQKKELTLAETRNKACKKAKGKIIIHWEEEGYYSGDWVNRQVNALCISGADITGLNKTAKLLSWPDLQKKQLENSNETASWILGPTLCYWKKLWINYPFRTSKTDEITDFITHSKGTVYSHGYDEGYQGIKNPIPVPNKYNILPLVSCIMTTSDSEMLVPFALNYFLYQDYPNVELIIIDDGENAAPELILRCPNVKYFYLKHKKTIGAKKNMACNISKGSIIIHWDDQDWYAHDWIQHQVTALLTSGADISGLKLIQTFPITRQKSIPKEKYSSLFGATMVYWKSIWNHHKFKELPNGENEDFQQQAGTKIFAHNYVEGFNTNIYIKQLDRQLPDDPLMN